MIIEKNISILAYNTFGIDVLAKEFARFDHPQQLESIQTIYRNKLLVLGGGSNILLTRDFDGLVLKNEISGIEIIHEDDDYVFIKTGAGENWHKFVCYCIEHNYAGIENLSLIPGNVGAAPMQNIGAYGVEIKDVFEELEAFHIEEKKIWKFAKEDCAFNYRDSIFKKKYKGQLIITSVTFRLNKKPIFNTSYGAIEQELEKMNITELSIKSISQAIIQIRSSKLPDPSQLGNAGSFFKNPIIKKKQLNEIKAQWQFIPSFPFDADSVKVPAGWLIEQCGWKGYRKGDAGCYSKQALVLVNYGKATGMDIYSLSEEIIQSVSQTFNIKLDREVNIVA